jgi:hypothetical protein
MLNTQHHLFALSHAQFDWVKQQVADLLISNSMQEPNSTSKVYHYTKLKYNEKVHAAGLAPTSCPSSLITFCASPRLPWLAYLEQ